MPPRSAKPAPSSGGSPAIDVYVGLLLVALGALSLGIWMMYAELARYGYQLGP